MKRVDVIVIGAGQAGLAMSRCLCELGIEHLVLERGRVAERWRSERWDSLRLLTPRWQSRLPGWHYRGADPHGYMDMNEVTQHLVGYAGSFSAPVQGDTKVLRVEGSAGRYQVHSDRGTFLARAVVIATGDCDSPRVPAFANQIAPDIHQTVPSRYRNPTTLPPGGVLVVGASASGVQIADELARSGRAVTVAVGRHVRLPRLHRGRDIMWWLDVMGIWDERADDAFDLTAARAQPSLQLIGTPERRSLDLGTLHDLGVDVVGRAVAAEGNRVRMADDLARTINSAGDKLARLLERIEAFIRHEGLSAALPDATPLRSLSLPTPPTMLDLRARGIHTIVWATGFARRYPWLQLPVLDARGEIRHEGGITPAPGVYVLGLRFLRRRNSNFIDGVGADAIALADHLARHLGRKQDAAA